MRASLNEQSFFNLQDEFNCVENCAIKFFLNAGLYSDLRMIFPKILVLLFSASAIPSKYESKNAELDSLDAKARMMGERETVTQYKNQTIEQSSNTSSEIFSDEGTESYQNTFDRIGWRRRMTDWGDLDTLRALSIAQVS